MTDFTKLNDRIVRQAWEFSNLTLSEELKTKLLQDKIRRAADMIQAREYGTVYFKVKD
jgi:23S rRNA pseudoU1915 N3-methylase RlmH